ncbi:MAG TPA: hypothetical protein VIL69_08585 [Roseomonas sp.]
MGQLLPLDLLVRLTVALAPGTSTTGKSYEVMAYGATIWMRAARQSG